MKEAVGASGIQAKAPGANERASEEGKKRAWAAWDWATWAHQEVALSLLTPCTSCMARSSAPIMLICLMVAFGRGASATRAAARALCSESLRGVSAFSLSTSTFSLPHKCHQGAHVARERGEVKTNLSRASHELENSHELCPRKHASPCSMLTLAFERLARVGK